MQANKFNTAPARLGKREMPKVWDLFAPEHAVHPAAVVHPAAAVHPVASAAAIEERPPFLAHMPPDWDGQGSWPRYSKRRTSEDEAMSLWEVQEALKFAAVPGSPEEVDLTDLEALVAAEEEASGDDLLAAAGFVESVFGTAEPGATNPPAPVAPGLRDAAAIAGELFNAMAAEQGLPAPAPALLPAQQPLDGGELLEMLRAGDAPVDSAWLTLHEGPTSPSPRSVTDELGFGAVVGSFAAEVGLFAGREQCDLSHEALAAQLGVAAINLRASSPELKPRPPTAAAASSSAAPKGGPGRNGAERKEWSALEDETIREMVLAYGGKWRKIASMLPGRSDDAVRNRWNRLRNDGAPGPAPTAGGEAAATPGEAAGGASRLEPPSATKRSAGSASSLEGGSGRVSWTKAEDATILASVAELGHKWNKLAERLPGRTDHAIRNRFHRLQTMMGDSQRKHELELSMAPHMPAPSPPLPVAAQ